MAAAAVPRHVLGRLAAEVVALPALAAYALAPEALHGGLAEAAAAPPGGVHLRLALRGGEAVGLVWGVAGAGLVRGAYLRLLAVLPRAAGAGLGARLLADFEAAWRPSGGWFVLAGADNVAAAAFYRRFGYREVGALDGFVRAGVAERLLWRPRAAR